MWQEADLLNITGSPTQLYVGFWITEHVDTYLTHPHLWVQLAASQLFGLLFAACQPENLLPGQLESRTQYLAIDTRKKVIMSITLVWVENSYTSSSLHFVCSRTTWHRPAVHICILLLFVYPVNYSLILYVLMYMYCVKYSLVLYFPLVLTVYDKNLARKLISIPIVLQEI